MGWGEPSTGGLDSAGYTECAQRPSSTKTRSYLHLFTYRARSPWLPARKPYFSLFAAPAAPLPLPGTFLRTSGHCCLGREAEDETPWRGSQQRLNSNQRPPHIQHLKAPFQNGPPGGQGWSPAEWRGLGLWPVAQLRGLASCIPCGQKDRGRGQQLPACLPASSLARLLEEFAIVSREGKGLALKFG